MRTRHRCGRAAGWQPAKPDPPEDDRRRRCGQHPSLRAKSHRQEAAEWGDRFSTDWINSGFRVRCREPCRSRPAPGLLELEALGARYLRVPAPNIWTPISMNSPSRWNRRRSFQTIWTRCSAGSGRPTTYRTSLGTAGLAASSSGADPGDGPPAGLPRRNIYRDRGRIALIDALAATGKRSGARPGGLARRPILPLRPAETEGGPEVRA